MGQDNNKNLILAIVLSGLVMLVWMFFFPPQEPVQQPASVTAGQVAAPGTAAVPGIPGVAAADPGLSAAPEAPRIDIDTPRLKGSLSLRGGRLDVLSLKDYHETLDEGSPEVELLRPVSELEAYYAVYGWASGPNVPVPGADTLFEAESEGPLSLGKPVVLKWDNGQGLIFRRTYSVDENFMFSVTQSVENTTGAPVQLFPYGIVARHGQPKTQGFWVLHEGIVRQTDNKLSEIDYSDVKDLSFVSGEGAPAEITTAEKDGWIGFTDKYWMTALIPPSGSSFTSVVKYIPGADVYQIETRQPVIEVAAGAKTEVTSRLFAGAKEWETIRAYQNEHGVYRFIDSIDWGWFFFLTKPIFWVLHLLHGFLGNMGWAIIGLTIVLKALVLPLAYKSYVSMAKMKELQPEMEKIKERVGDDRMKMQQEIMALYKREKVNPAAGCLPILLQIPIFFSLYKVILVTIELRHAPWVGWIRDLSAPDPSSILNLFGLLPWGVPEADSFFFIFSLGVLPILLGLSMWLQQKLNPAPTDPTQQMIFAWMPWIFMFMLGSFASGLVLYWITNNLITFTQQYLIMRSHGAKPDIFGNIKAGMARKKTAAAKPANSGKAPKK